MPGPKDLSKRAKFNPLAGRCNVEYIRHENIYICRVPACTWSGKTDMAVSQHAGRTHEMRCHVFKRPTAEDRKRVEEQRARYAAERQARKGAQAGEKVAQDRAQAVGRVELVPFPCELDAPRGADGLCPGTLLGMRCLRQKGLGNLRISSMIDESGQDAVQVAVTWVAANLPALHQWLGRAGTGGGAPSSRLPPLLWRPGKEDLVVSASEVRVGTQGRSLAAAVVLSLVCMATGRHIKPWLVVTGDVDLRGHILDVGGLEAKLSACHSRRITTVVLPEVSLAWLRAADKGAWPAALRRYLDGEGVSLLGVSHVVELLEAALEDCPPLPPTVQACLVAGAGSAVGLGYWARPQGGGTGPSVVQACVRKPGHGRVLLSGQQADKKARTALEEAQSWVVGAQRAVAGVLGQGDESELRREGALPGAGEDLHVLLGGDWDGVDTSLLGGAVAVALVSLLLRRWPRADVAVLGAFNLEGQLLPSEKLGPQHMAVLRAQGFNAVVVTDARRMLDEQEAAVTEMEREGVELWATAPHGLSIMPLLPRIFGQ